MKAATTDVVTVSYAVGRHGRWCLLITTRKINDACKRAQRYRLPVCTRLLLYAESVCPRAANPADLYSSSFVLLRGASSNIGTDHATSYCLVAGMQTYYFCTVVFKPIIIIIIEAHRKYKM